MSLFAIFIYYIIQKARKNREDVRPVNHFDKSGLKVFLKISAGLAGIYFGARWVVDGAIVIDAGVVTGATSGIGFAIVKRYYHNLDWS